MPSGELFNIFSYVKRENLKAEMEVADGVYVGDYLLGYVTVPMLDNVKFPYVRRVVIVDCVPCLEVVFGDYGDNLSPISEYVIDWEVIQCR